jgi:hypothetical protein
MFCSTSDVALSAIRGNDIVLKLVQYAVPREGCLDGVKRTPVPEAVVFHVRCKSVLVAPEGEVASHASIVEVIAGRTETNFHISAIATEEIAIALFAIHDDVIQSARPRLDHITIYMIVSTIE